VQSTYENFKYRYDPQTNPYNRGILNNFKEVFCSRIPPSKNNFRSKVPLEPLDSYRRTDNTPLGPMMKRTTRQMELLVGNSVYNEHEDEESHHRDGSENEARSKDSESKDSGLTDKSVDLSRILHTEGVEGQESPVRRHPPWETTSQVPETIIEVGESNTTTGPRHSTQDTV